MKRSLNGSYNAFAPHYAARYLAEFQYRFKRRCDPTALPRPILVAVA